MKLKWSNMVFKKWEELRQCSSFLWVGRKKGKRHFAACAFARPRGGLAKPERKDERKRADEGRPLGRIGVEFLQDFRSGLGIYG